VAQPDRVGVAVLQQHVEKIRGEASMGPDEKDGSTRSFVGVGETLWIGSQKSTITGQDILVQA
jgi:hypothetical protein